MTLQQTDLFIVERAGAQYHMTATQVADFVGAIRDFTVADINARDALTNLKVGDRVFVTDASADTTVTSGWAVYRVQSVTPNAFGKVQEQESMDISISGANLGYTASAASGIITNTTGDNAVIPLADATNAGLASPAMFSDSHKIATSGLTAATNPVNVATNQVVTFSIAQLATLP